MIRNFCQAVLRRVFQFFQEFFYFPVFCPERSFFCRILPCRCGNIVRTRVRLRPKSQPCPLPCRSVRESAYLRRRTLSDLRFCLSPLPLYPLPEEMPGCSFCPCLWQGSAAPLSSRLPFLTKERWCAALLHTSPYGKECRTTPRSASPYGKGRCHEVTEGIRVNPQKGRHLLCSFCPYEMRSMSRKGRELCPEWGKEGGKTAI